MKRAVMNKLGGRLSKNLEIGLYFVTSRRYSRHRCISTLLALSPSVRIIYVKLGRKQIERAYLTKTSVKRGRPKWHFFSSEPLAVIELSNTLDR